MREINFRAKCVDTGKWVYGNLVELELTYIYPKVLRTGYEKQMQDKFTDCMVYRHEVIPETIGQWVGRKDCTNKEIYEGDVVRCWGGESAFGYHEFEANILIDEFYQLRVSDIGYYDEFYILGNIHENPELLEATK